MFPKEYRRFLAALCLVAAFCCVPAKAVTVSAAASQPTFIGNTVAGKTYRVTASGVGLPSFHRCALTCGNSVMIVAPDLGSGNIAHRPPLRPRRPVSIASLP